ncbi:MAG: cyclodeaminase/cyclohydrolase family protein [Planctomycetota bacterium]
MTDPFSAPTPFLQALAAKTSTPGGGSAAALVGAISAALSSMAGQFTLGKKKFAEVEGTVKTLTERSLRLMDEFQIYMRQDAEAFQEVMLAYQDKGPDQKVRFQNALKRATEAPLAILRSSVEAMQIAAKMVVICNPNLRTDAGATGVFGLAAARVASWNVKINLVEFEDKTLKNKMFQEVEQQIQEAIRLEEQIRKHIEQSFVGAIHESPA